MGGTNVGTLAPVLIAGTVGGVALGRFLPLPGWLSPIGAAVWLYGYWKNNSMVRIVGLLMILFGLLDKLGMTAKVGNLLGGLKLGALPASATPADVHAALAGAQSSGKPTVAPPAQTPAAQQPIAGIPGFTPGNVTAVASGIDSVVNAFSTSQSTGTAQA